MAALRHLGAQRRALLVGIAVALLLLAALPVAADADMGPAGLDDADPIFVPLRWCAVQGSSAVTNPAGVGEPDTDAVLWRRHERATDNIWFPGALISFRSAFTAAAMTAADFPVIPDPNPPPSGPGSEGDIVVSNSELLDARASCLMHWDAIELMLGTSFEGPVGINFRQFVTSTGSPSTTIGRGNFSVSSTAGPCSSEIIANNGDQAFAAVRDNSFDLPSDAHDHLLAHELGHTLFLGHGNGLDDDGDGSFDGCDGSLFSTSAPDESSAAAPPSLMTSGGSSEVITTLQRGTVVAGTPGRQAGARGVAKVTSGAQFDPSGSLVDVKVRSDHRVDHVHDAPPAIDIVSAGMARNDQLKRFVATHSLFGTIPNSGSFEYDLFFDLDNSGATGGSPAALGFPTPIDGIDLVTSVTVKPRRKVSARAWRFRTGAFRPVPRRMLKASLTRSRDADTGAILFDAVAVQMPTKQVGRTANRVRMQAIARTRRRKRPVIDRLPDSRRILRPFFLAPLRYPTAVLTPQRVRPGGTVTVDADGLIPGGKVELFLGDVQVGTGKERFDAKGRLKTSFVVPSKAREGPRLITVGVEGKALSADALLQVDAKAPAVGRKRRSSMLALSPLVGVLLVAVPLVLSRRRR